MEAILVLDGWELDENVCNVLERIPLAIEHATNNAVEAWIERFDIRPLYEVGQFVLGARVERVLLKRAEYLTVHPQHGRRSVAFEDAHVLAPKIGG